MKKRTSRFVDTSRKANSKQKKDVSTHTLIVMIVLVLMISFLSAGMYVYAFYGGGVKTNAKIISSDTEKAQEIPLTSGKAMIQIIKPPEN